MSKIESKEEEYISFSLADLEVPVLSGDYVKAEKALQLIMLNQRKGKMEFNLRPAERILNTEQTDTEAYQVIEKIALLITKMFSDPKYIPSEQMFQEYVMGKRFIAYLFAASSYQNTDHIVRNLGFDKKNEFTKDNIRRFLMLYIPESSFELPWVNLAHALPSEVSRAYLGLMSSATFLMSETANIRLNDLAALAKKMPTLTFSRPENLEMMTSGYFHVSNLTGPDKYEFKTWAVNNYQKFMTEYLSKSLKDSIVKKVAKKPKKGKRTILIIHEHYRKGHAMYRCYNSFVAGLANDFNVVGLSNKNYVDEIGKKDHHEFYEYDDVYDFDKVITDILEIKPDIIYYPSIGMTNFVPMLATLRLAPIQCMTPGHPSSSMINTIDHIFYHSLGAHDKDIQAFMIEKSTPILGVLNVMPVSDYSLIPPKDNESVIKIAVNGVIPKVNSKLIDICNRITQGTELNIEFQFFLASPRQDLEYYAAVSMLRRYLPNSKVHMYQDYNKYINILAQCRLAIPTIPFGGSNSNMDCVRANTPKLFVIDESDFVGYSDYQIWDKLDVLNGYCESEDELVKRAVLYIDNPGEMNEYKAAIDNVAESGLLNVFDESKVDTRLADLFNKLM